jgi:hypothetical protein
MIRLWPIFKNFYHREEGEKGEDEEKKRRFNHRDGKPQRKNS